MRAYIQYMTAYGEWVVTERMPIDKARKECAAMQLHGMEAFVRVCN